MPRDGTKNLIPLNKRTKEAQKKIQSMGGQSSKEAARGKYPLRKRLWTLFVRRLWHRFTPAYIIPQAERLLAVREPDTPGGHCCQEIVRPLSLL